MKARAVGRVFLDVVDVVLTALFLILFVLPTFVIVGVVLGFVLGLGAWLQEVHEATATKDPAA